MHRGSKQIVFVDDTYQSPSSIPNAKGELVKNSQGLTYEDWIQKDNLIM